MADTWRLFIAIELPSDILSALSEIQTRLKQQVPPRTVRWVDPKGIHLTLKFLGDVPLFQRSTIEHALAEIAPRHTAFHLTAQGLGCFPNLKRPRVVWVGMQGQLQTLSAVHDDVEAWIAPMGYPAEERAFNPHLTLGRVNRDADRENITRLGAIIEHTSSGEAQSWQVETISLMRSELKPGGAVYTELFRAPLRQPDPDTR